MPSHSLHPFPSFNRLHGHSSLIASDPRIYQHKQITWRTVSCQRPCFVERCVRKSRSTVVSKSSFKSIFAEYVSTSPEISQDNLYKKACFPSSPSSQGLSEPSDIHLHIPHHETLSYHCLSGLRDQYPRYRYTITNICYQHCLTIFYPSLCTLETNRRQRKTR